MPGKKSVSGNSADGGRNRPAGMRRKKKVWWAFRVDLWPGPNSNAPSVAKCFIGVASYNAEKLLSRDYHRSLSPFFCCCYNNFLYVTCGVIF